MTKQDTTPDEPAHTSGTRKAEEIGAEPGNDDTKAPAHTARDSTSINAEYREPIDPKMPEMPPA